MLPPFRPSRYVRVGSPEEAVRELMADPGARVLAGGTLVMQGRDAGCARLVDITDCGLDGVEEAGGDWVIGAATPVGALLGAQGRRLPGALRDATERFGPPAIRAVGTVGGNLMGSGSFGHLAPALLALDARLRWLGPGGAQSETPVRDIWHSFPRPSGLLTHVVVPGDGTWAWSGLDQIERTALDHWICVLALAVPADGGARRWGVGAATALPMLVQGDDPAGVATFDDHRASAEYRTAMLRVVADRLRERAGG